MSSNRRGRTMERNRNCPLGRPPIGMRHSPSPRLSLGHRSGSRSYPPGNCQPTGDAMRAGPTFAVWKDHGWDSHAAWSRAQERQYATLPQGGSC